MTKNKIDDLTEVLLEDINGVKHSYTLSKLGYKRYTSCPIVNLANYFLNNFPSSNFEIGLRKNDCVLLRLSRSSFAASRKRIYNSQQLEHFCSSLDISNDACYELVSSIFNNINIASSYFLERTYAGSTYISFSINDSFDSSIGFISYTLSPKGNISNDRILLYPSCVFHLKKYPKALLTMKELLVQI